MVCVSCALGVMTVVSWSVTEGGGSLVMSVGGMYYVVHVYGVGHRAPNDLAAVVCYASVVCSVIWASAADSDAYYGDGIVSSAVDDLWTPVPLTYVVCNHLVAKLLGDSDALSFDGIGDVEHSVSSEYYSDEVTVCLWFDVAAHSVGVDFHE